jgi:hypothetical protein
MSPSGSEAYIITIAIIPALGFTPSAFCFWLSADLLPVFTDSCYP